LAPEPSNSGEVARILRPGLRNSGEVARIMAPGLRNSGEVARIMAPGPRNSGEVARILRRAAGVLRGPVAASGVNRRLVRDARRSATAMCQLSETLITRESFGREQSVWPARFRNQKNIHVTRISFL
jgi:hypothetical protein